MAISRVDSQLEPCVGGGIVFAVVIVCRNALEALKRTLDSVGRMSDPRLLIIVIDGASTDGTGAYLEAPGHTLFHFISEADQGIYDAMNKGWKAAPDGAHVLFLGAGDLLLSLPKSKDLIDASGSKFKAAIGSVKIGGEPFNSRWTAEMYLRNTAHHQGLMILKAAWPEPPFDRSLRIYGDWDFNLKLMRRGVDAQPVSGFQTFAESGGASWRHDLVEIRRVATRHGGRIVGWAAWLLNRVSLWRRERMIARTDAD